MHTQFLVYWMKIIRAITKFYKLSNSPRNIKILQVLIILPSHIARYMYVDFKGNGYTFKSKELMT